MYRSTPWLAIVLCLAAITSQAEVIFIGPTPYRSAADSPFNLSGLGTTFFLEDFENSPPFGVPFQSPGIPAYYMGSEVGLGFLATRNSVDSDDGLLDGIDGGSSLRASTTFADTGHSFIEGVSVLFDRDELGFLPTALGFVITSKDNYMASFSIFDEEFQLLGTFDLSRVQSDPGNGLDDLFVGVATSTGIFGMQYLQGVRSTPNGRDSGFTYIDHFQYGFVVPEPSSFACAGIAGLLYWAWRFVPFRGTI